MSKCKTCKHNSEPWYSEACDGCTRADSRYEQDLISRQNAIDALGEEPEIWNDSEEEWAYRNAWVEHISAIKSLPSAEPPYQYSEAYVTQLRGERDILQDMVDNMAKPKTGEWVEYWKSAYDGTEYRWAKCSECGQDMPGAETNFCPNCGARMKGGDAQ